MLLDCCFAANCCTFEAVVGEAEVSSCSLMLSVCGLGPISSSVITNRTLQSLYEQQGHCLVHQMSINIYVTHPVIHRQFSVFNKLMTAHCGLTDTQFLGTNKTLCLMSECLNILFSSVSGFSAAAVCLAYQAENAVNTSDILPLDRRNTWQDLTEEVLVGYENVAAKYFQNRLSLHHYIITKDKESYS